MIPPAIMSETDTRRTLSRTPWPAAASVDTFASGTAANAAAAEGAVVERLRDGTAEGCCPCCPCCCGCGCG